MVLKKEFRKLCISDLELVLQMNNDFKSLYVDDYDIEADGARDLGITSFHIDRNGDRDKEWKIKSLKEIIDFVEKGLK